MPYESGKPRLAIVAIIGAILTNSASLAADYADLSDVIARIDYGYFASDVRIVEAAQSELSRVPAPAGARAYYSAYAAYRLIQIDSADGGRNRRERLAHCFDVDSQVADDVAWAVEARVLVAACALSQYDGSSSHGPKRDFRLAGALAAARDLDPDNPRLQLIAALALAANDDDAVADVSIESLERAASSFEPNVDPGEILPSWGRAETLAQLGRLYLRAGRLRDARDVIEQALIEAPEFHFALSLQKELSLRR